MSRYKALITYLGALFFAIGTAIRFLGTFRGHPSLWTIVGLLVAFLLLLAIELWLPRRSRCYIHLYLAAQIGITSKQLSLPSMRSDGWSNVPSCRKAELGSSSRVFLIERSAAKVPVKLGRRASRRLWLNILLTLPGYRPGLVHAVWIIVKKDK